MPVPTMQEQRSIVGYLDSLQTKVSELRCLQSTAQKELATIIPAILDKAFKGLL